MGEEALGRRQSEENPIRIFKDGWTKAKAANDPNAGYCTLATAGLNGKPSMRTVVLRKVEDRSFIVFINSNSPKWRDLEDTGQLEMHVFWPTLLHQYRIRGTIEQLPEAEMRRHWQNKAYNSKLLDLYYEQFAPQSSVIESRDLLLANIEKLRIQYPNSEDIPFPASCKGVGLKADLVEVWHGSEKDRLHMRLLFELGEKGWSRQTLVP